MINLDSYGLTKTRTNQVFVNNRNGTYTCTETCTAILTQTEMDRIEADLNSQRTNIQTADSTAAISNIDSDLARINV